MSCAILAIGILMKLAKLNKLSGFTITELAFVVVFIAIFILLLSPFIANIREKAKEVTCEENLEKIGLGLNVYASEHNGGFPADLAKLVEGGYVEDEKVFNCPSTQKVGSAKTPEYHYTTGYTILSPSESAIVFDKDSNHKKGRHILYVNGEVIWEETK